MSLLCGRGCRLVGDSLSFGLCHFCVAVAAGWWVTVCHLGCHFCVAVAAGWGVRVCHLGCVTLCCCGCRLVGDSLSSGFCHFCVVVAVGWWVTVCHLGCVTLVLESSSSMSLPGGNGTPETATDRGWASSASRLLLALLRLPHRTPGKPPPSPAAHS